MALTGNEIVYVQGIAQNGAPAATEFPTTTQDIANLGESGGDPTFDSVIFSGSSSGETTVVATAIAGTNTLTLPAATDTLVGKATTDTLTNKTLTAPVVGTTLTMADAANIVLNATTGTKIGTATSQKLAFYNSTPVVQPAATGSVTGFVAGSGTASKSDSVWAGTTGSAAYTVGDIVTALKALGLLAA